MDVLITKKKIKKIVFDYIIEVEARYNKYDSYRGCKYSVYDRKSKAFIFGGGCGSIISSPKDLMDRMTIIIMNRKKEG